MDIQFTDQGEESPSVVATEKFVQTMKSSREMVAPRIREIQERVNRNWNALSQIRKILEIEGISRRRRRELEIQARNLQNLIYQDDLRLSEVSS